jgi:predicted DNA-binding protein
MDVKRRFVLRLPERSGVELDALADQVGLTASALVRIAVNKLLEDHDWLPAGHNRRAA